MNYETFTQIALWIVAGLFLAGAFSFLAYGWYRNYTSERAAVQKKQRHLNGLRTYR